MNSWLNDAAKWQEVDATPSADGMPWTTHEGTLEVFDRTFRVYRLNTGETVIHADDFNAFLAEVLLPKDSQ